MAGTYTPEETSDVEVLREVDIHNPSYSGKLLKYKRALIQGQMIHSEAYQKVLKRNSYTIQWSLDGSENYGQVVCFLELERRNAYSLVRKWHGHY